MKKYLLIILAILMLFLVSCNKKANNKDKENGKTDEGFVDFNNLLGESYMYAGIDDILLLHKSF